MSRGRRRGREGTSRLTRRRAAARPRSKSPAEEEDDKSDARPARGPPDEDEGATAAAAEEARESGKDGEEGDEGGGGEDSAAEGNGEAGPADADGSDDDDDDDDDVAAPSEDEGDDGGGRNARTRKRSHEEAEDGSQSDTAKQSLLVWEGGLWKAVDGAPAIAVPSEDEGDDGGESKARARNRVREEAEDAKAGEESEYEGGEGALARGMDLFTDDDEEEDDDDGDEEKKDDDGEETEEERGKEERRGRKPKKQRRRYPNGATMAHQAKIAEETTAWDDDDWREVLLASVSSSPNGDVPGGCSASEKKPPFKALFPDPSSSSIFNTKRVLPYLLPSPGLEKLYDDRLRAARRWDESRRLVEAARQSVAEAEERVRIEEAEDAAADEKLKAATRVARLAELDEPCRWNDMMKRMEDYKAEAGNVDLPEPAELLNREDDGTGGEGAAADKYLKELSRFGQELRFDYREGKLRSFPHLVSAVQILGFKWDDFDRRLERMKEYKHLHGHCRVKKTDGRDIYDCYRYLRHLYLSRSTRTAMAVSMKQAPKKTKGPVILTNERLTRLVEVMDPAELEHTSALKFEKHVEALREHRAKTGHCVHPDGPERDWLRTYQRAYELWTKKRSSDPARIPRPLTEERLDVLRKIGACLTKNCRCVRRLPGSTKVAFLGAEQAGDSPGKAPLVPHPAASWARSGTDAVWEKRFNRLNRYKAEHGNLEVSYRDAKHRNLCALLRDLRRAYRQYATGVVSGKVAGSFVLDDVTAGRLRDIVGEKNLLEQGQIRFDDRLATLRKHRSDTGHCVFLDDKDMADWVKKVRRNYSLMKKGMQGNKEKTSYGHSAAKIDTARVALLDEVGLCLTDECECPNAPRKAEQQSPLVDPAASNPPPPFANPMSPAEAAMMFNPITGQPLAPLQRKRTRKERENEDEEERRRRKKERKRRKERERLEALAIMENVKGKFDQQSVTLESL